MRHTGKLCGLLLCHAVDSAESPDEVATMDADDFPVGKDFRKNIERMPVIRIVECGDQHHTIRDVKVGITGGQSLVAKDNRGGHRKFNYFERVPILISSTLQLFQILLNCHRVFRVRDAIHARTGVLTQILERVVQGFHPQKMSDR